MADPISLMLIASTALSAVGAVQQAGAASSAAKHNAAVADRDSFVADQNRKLALDQSRIDAEDAAREHRRVTSTIRAQYGASGLELAGSPLDVLEDTSVEQALDVRRIEFEGRARGREGALQMLGLSESASLSRSNASSQRTAGLIGGAGAVLSGAGTQLRRTA